MGESIQLFGSETMMKMHAASKSIEGVTHEWKDMSEAEKQLVRIDYAKAMYEKAHVTGQANRESEMYVNTLGNLKDTWEMFKANLGTAALEGMNGAMRSLDDIIKNIDVESLGKKLGKVMDKVASVDWWLVSKQLGTIWGYVKEFLSAAWDTFKNALEPVGDVIKDIFEALGITGNTEANTKNMDSVNKFLLDSKPYFEWLSENGDTVAENIIKIGKAFATWQGLKLTMKTIDFVTSFGKGTIVSWIVEKCLGLSMKPNTLGATIGKGLMGAFPVVAALSIPMALAVTFEWWGTDEQKKAVEKRKNDVMGIDNKTLFKDKKTGKTDTFDWSATKESFAKSWSDLKTWCQQKLAQEPFELTIFGDFATLGEWLAKKFSADDIGDDLKDLAQPFRDFGDSIKKFGQDVKLFFEDPFLFFASKSPKWYADFKGFKDKYVGDATSFSQAVSNIFGNIGSNIANGISNSINSAMQSMETMLNKIIGGLNSFFKALGINKTIPSVNFASHKKYNKYSNKRSGNLEAYAKGTDDAKGGLSLVGERGREIVADERLGVFMANSPTLLNLTKGATVLSNKNTEKFLKATGIKAFAKGKNEDSFWKNIWSYITNPSKILDKIISGLGNFGSTALGQGLSTFFSGAIKNSVMDFINNVINSEEVQMNPNNPNNIFQGSAELLKTIAKYITSGFGNRSLFGKGEFHPGIDLAGGMFGAGMPVYSQSTGKVLTSGYSDTAGYWVVVDSNGTIFKYMHMQKGSLTKKAGQLVTAGEVIGKVGSTGFSTGAHLHFQVEKGGKAVNPLAFFNNFGGAGGGSASRWTSQIQKAASYFGETLTSNEMARIIQQINTESGGNERAIQGTGFSDANSRRGIYAKGLLQYIQSTFDSYALKGHTNIFSGFDQLLAFFNNSDWRKNLPSLGEKRGWTPRGYRRKYANGGLITQPTNALMGEAGTEAVVPLSNARALKPFGQSVLNAIKEEANDVSNGAVYEFSIPVVIDGKEVARATASFTQEELDRNKRRQSRLKGNK